MVPSRAQARTWARGLGWISLGLGVIKLLAPRPLASAVGLPGQATLMRACGMRELSVAAGLLQTQRPAPWLWARVAGDAMDLVALAQGVPGRRTAGGTVALATGLAALAVVDAVCARRLSTPAAAPRVDYSRRSGWPLPAEEMRGAAREEVEQARIVRTWPRLNGDGTGTHAAAAGEQPAAAGPPH